MADCPRILAVLAATLLAAAGVCRGQANFEPRRTIEEQIVAPSPQVAEMMRYEDAALNSCDGTATMSVPLFQWQAGDIDMSLSLNYRIGAFRVEEQSGWIGLGWSLAGTGVVTRSIAGLPDESGYESRSTSNLMSSTDALEYIRSLDLMQVDASLDRYSYSCPGGAGQFVILDGRIVQLPLTDNEVLFIRPGDITGGFPVRTPDGINYDFSVAEHSDFLYQTMNLSAPPYCYSYNAISAWHLSRITSASGETVTYEYADMPSWTRDHNHTAENHTVYRVMCNSPWMA